MLLAISVSTEHDVSGTDVSVPPDQLEQHKPTSQEEKG